MSNLEPPKDLPEPQCACPVHHDAAECARIRGGGSVRTFRGWECACPCHAEWDAKHDEEDDL